MKTLTVVVLIAMGSTNRAFAGDVSLDKKAVDRLCRRDADKIGCNSMTVGNGLGRCIYEYKQKNPKYSPSESCKNAMLKLRQDRLAGKMVERFGSYPSEPKPPLKPKSASAPPVKGASPTPPPPKK